MRKPRMTARVIALFAAAGLIGCGLANLRTVYTMEESPFYSQHKGNLKKIGVTQFSKGDCKCKFRLVESALFKPYKNRAVANYGEQDSIQNIIMNALSSKEDVVLKRDSKKITNWGPKPDSNLVQFEVAAIPEAPYGKGPQELADICKKYQVDGLLMGDYGYCIEVDEDSWVGESGARPFDVSMTVERPGYEAATPGGAKEDVLNAKLKMKISIYDATEGKVVYETPKEEARLCLKSAGTARESNMAVRNRDLDQIAPQVLSRAIRAAADMFILDIGKYYRVELVRVEPRK